MTRGASRGVFPCDRKVVLVRSCTPRYMGMTLSPHARRVWSDNHTCQHTSLQGPKRPTFLDHLVSLPSEASWFEHPIVAYFPLSFHKSAAVSINSARKMRLTLCGQFSCVLPSRLVSWMRKTLMLNLDEAVREAALWEVDKPREEWLFGYPAELALLAGQVGRMSWPT